MTFLGSVAAVILIWAWFNPHDAGEWLARARDPYHLIPRHQKTSKAKGEKK